MHVIVKAHRTVAVVLIAFLFLHLSSHLISLAGPQAHLTTLPLIRPLYRSSFTEPVLIALLGVQIGLGLMLAWRRRKVGIDHIWGKLQIISGLYIIFFVLLHTSAAFFARYGNQLDTNFWWPASTLAHPTLRFFFYPYYFLGVTALSIHLAAALHFRGSDKAIVRLVALSGPFMALLILAGVGGYLHRFVVPAPYMDALEANSNKPERDEL
jgi:hypothetical protein